MIGRIRERLLKKALPLRQVFLYRVSHYNLSASKVYLSLGFSRILVATLKFSYSHNYCTISLFYEAHLLLISLVSVETYVKSLNRPDLLDLVVVHPTSEDANMEDVEDLRPSKRKAVYTEVLCFHVHLATS